MTHHPEIWDCLKVQLPARGWIPLADIYGLVAGSLQLDREDQDPESPKSDGPKWKRNVRNVLQYRKRKGYIEWNGQSGYRL